MVTLVASGREMNDVLIQAARNGDVNGVNNALAAGADVNAVDDDEGDTPLHFASDNGHEAVVGALLAAEADVNAVNEYPGNTPLHNASRYGHEAVVDALLAAGADVNAVNEEGNTPLDVAITDGVRAMIQAHIKGKSTGTV